MKSGTLNVKRKRSKGGYSLKALIGLDRLHEGEKKKGWTRLDAPADVDSLLKSREQRTDVLTIKALVAECRVGVLEAERATPQVVWIDLELEIDARRASASDDVKDAIDYSRVVSDVKRLVEKKPYHLLETMAEEIAALVLRQFTTNQVTVRDTKRALPGIDSAAIEISRTL